nr:hypothetical protein [Tanacetum cinerariifolium]
NQDFHQIVDFVEASHIRIETTKEGTKILATVDGKLRTVSESSIRRNLKLNDEAGISSLPDAELFENLTLMGYNISPNQKFTFQKGQFSPQWKYLIYTIMVFNFSKMIFDGMGEGSKTPTEPHHTPISKASQSSQHELPSPSLLPVPTESLPTMSLYLLLGMTVKGACPTDFGLEADQDRANIPKTFTLPSDSTPRVTSLAADEAQELEINRLKAKIKLLEDKDRGVAEQSRDDAPIKGRRVVPTATPTIPTAALIFTTATNFIPYTRRKGKEMMVESDTPKKKKLQEQIDV